MHPRLELIHEAAQGTERDAPPLLFVHGAFCAAWCWQRTFLPWFARQGFDCWAISLEGHGDSDGHQYLSAISIDDYVRNLSAAVKRIKRTPIMIGHSMGGFVLQQYLTSHTLPAAAFLASVPPTGLASSSLRLLTQAPVLLLNLNLYQQGSYNPVESELRDLLLSHDAPAATTALLTQCCQQESQRAVMDMTLVNPLAIRPISAAGTGAGGGGRHADLAGRCGGHCRAAGCERRNPAAHGAYDDAGHPLGAYRRTAAAMAGHAASARGGRTQLPCAGLSAVCMKKAARPLAAFFCPWPSQSRRCGCHSTSGRPSALFRWRASTNSASDKRLRYWRAATDTSLSCAAVTTARSARRQTERA